MTNEEIIEKLNDLEDEIISTQQELEDTKQELEDSKQEIEDLLNDIDSRVGNAFDEYLEYVNAVFDSIASQLIDGELDLAFHKDISYNTKDFTNRIKRKYNL